MSVDDERVYPGIYLWNYTSCRTVTSKGWIESSELKRRLIPSLAMVDRRLVSSEPSGLSRNLLMKMCA